MTNATIDTTKKPQAFVRKRNPKLRYCIHDRSERQQCAKCNKMNRVIETTKEER